MNSQTNEHNHRGSHTGLCQSGDEIEGTVGVVSERNSSQRMLVSNPCPRKVAADRRHSRCTLSESRKNSEFTQSRARLGSPPANKRGGERQGKGYPIEGTPYERHQAHLSRRARGRRLVERRKIINRSAIKPFPEFVDEILERRYNHKLRLENRNKIHKMEKKIRRRIRNLINGDIVTESSGDFTALFSDLIAPLKTLASSEYSDLYMSLLVLLYQFYRSKNVLDVGAAVYLFWRTLRGTKTAESFLSKDEIYDIFRAYSPLRTESLHDKLKKGGNFLIQVIKGDAIAPIRNLFLAAASCKLFDKDIAKQIYTYLGKPPPMSVMELITYVWDQFLCLVRFGENWYNSKSFFSAAVSSNPVVDCLNRADHLLYYKNKLSIGLPVEGYMSISDFINECTLLCLLMDKLLASSSTLADLRVIRLRRLDLENARFEAAQLANYSSRMVPFGIILHGTPGVGKSVIMDHLSDLWCKACGREFTKEQVFHRIMTTLFWELYQPFSQKIIHYSEIGNVLPSMLRGPDEVIKELTSLIDSLPFPTNQASVETKGKVFAHPELVIADTNNPNLGIREQVVNPEAYLRRFTFVEAEVKPEFCIRGSTGIDPAKAAAAGGPDMDRWLFTIKRRIVKTNNQGSDKIFLYKGDIYELSKTMTELYKQHLREQASAKMVKNTSSQYYLCPTYVPESRSALDYSFKVREWALDMEYKELDYETYKLHFPFYPDDEHLKDEVWDLYQQGSTAVTEADSSNLIARIKAKYKRKNNMELEEKEAPPPRPIVPTREYITYREYLHIWYIQAYAFCYVNTPRWFTWLWSLISLIFTTIGTLFFVTVLFAATLCLFKGWGGSLVIVWAQNKIHKKLWENLYWIRDSWSARIVNPFESDLWRKHGESILIMSTAIAAAAAAFRLFRKTSSSESKVIDDIIEQTNEQGRALKTVWNDLGYPAASEKRIPTLPVKNTESALSKEVEEHVEAGTSYKRVYLKDSAVWNTRQQVIIPGVFSGEAAVLYKKISRNVRAVRVESNSNIKGFILGIRGSYALINTHTLGSATSPRLRVSYTGITSPDNRVFKDTIITSANRYDLPNDMSVLRLSEVCFTDITAHLGDYTGTGSMQGFFLDKVRTLRFEAVERKLMNPDVGEITVRDMIAYRCDEHARGLCGMPVLAGESSVFVAGLHEAGDEGSNLAFAVRISRSAVEEAIKKIPDPLLELVPMGPIALENGLLDPHPKSPFKHEHLPGIEYLGRYNRHTEVNQWSKLRKSLIFDDARECLDGYFEQEDHFAPPLMRPVKTPKGEYKSPYNRALRKFSQQTAAINPLVVSKVVDELVERFVTGLKAKGVTLKPLDMQSAIYGVPHDDYLRGVNLSTSMGFGFSGNKRVHIQDGELSQELSDEIDRILSAYRRGETANPIYEACLKDEPRSLEKVKEGNTRVFCVGSCAHLIVARMFLAPFYTLMVEHNELFCTSVGLNCHTCAHYIERDLAFSDRSMAGDVKNFDASMPFLIGHGSASIAYRVCEALGYNSEALLILRGILTDGLFPVLLLLNELMILAGKQPSGKYGTAEDNSLRNLIMLMVAWYMVTDLPFFDYNRPDTYGDDLKNAIKREVLHVFNNLVYQQICKEVYLMDYTSPDKNTALTETISTLDVEFLKRTYRFRRDIDRWVMPLHPSSIYKALQWVLPSRSVSESEQIAGALNSMMRELVFHLGERDHTSLCAALCRAYNERYQPLEDLKPLLFQNLLDSIFNPGEYGCPSGEIQPLGVIVAQSSGGEETANARQRKAVLGKSAPLNSIPTSLAGHSTGNVPCEDTPCTKHTLEHENTSLEEVYSACLFELQSLTEALEVFSKYGLPQTAPELRRYIHDLSETSFEEEARDKLALLSLKASLEATLDFINTLVPMPRLRTESALADMEDGTLTSTTDENLIDTAGSEFWMTDSGQAQFEEQGDRGFLSLDKFFARPVDIYTTSVGSTLAAVINPWDLYTLEPSVRAKLKNYAFLKAKLHLRVAISGTPFDYGCVMLSYQPLGSLNINLAKHKQNLITNAGWRPLYLNYLSQEKSSCVVSVCENAPVEIDCPFVFPKPVARLFDTSSAALGAATSYPDLAVMGELHMLAMGDIGTTATGSPAPRLTVYAWMTDVQLSGLTATVIALNTESGDADERKTGPVEKIASRAARISQILSKVPIIGAYAHASSIAFGALKDVAAAMGWSRPSLYDDPAQMRPEAMCSGALTICRDSAYKLTVDPKQELTVDPRCVGIMGDEMSLGCIAERMSYYTSFYWTPTQVPLTDIVWSSFVSPFLDSRLTTAATNIQPTAVRFAATPFAFWRGDMVFRFKFANNNFFRGKLAIIFEPNTYQKTLITAATSLNKQFVRVIDIQNTNTVDVCVNWCAHREWLPTLGATSDGQSSSYLERYNGFIYIVPFTQLVSTNSLPLQVHVFAAGKNMSFNQPVQENLPNFRSSTVSLVTQSGDADVRVAQPVTCLDMNESNASQAHIREDYFGEQPLSFRALLKRYIWNRNFAVSASSGSSRFLRYVAPAYPTNLLPYGTAVSASTDLYSYLKYAFVGMKGSYRHRVYWSNPNVTNNFMATRVSLLYPTLNGSQATSVNSGNAKAVLNGTNTTFQTVNGSIEFEVPLYTSNLFLLAFADTAPGGDVMTTYYTRGFACDIAVNGDIVASEIAEETAAGEDFSFLRFQGAPFYSTA